MWPASHCPLLGRVIPSSSDVSSGDKQRTGREGKEKRPFATFSSSQSGAFSSHETPCPRDGPGALGPGH